MLQSLLRSDFFIFQQKIFQFKGIKLKQKKINIHLRFFHLHFEVLRLKFELGFEVSFRVRI